MFKHNASARTILFCSALSLSSSLSMGTLSASEPLVPPPPAPGLGSPYLNVPSQMQGQNQGSLQGPTQGPGAPIPESPGTLQSHSQSSQPSLPPVPQNSTSPAAQTPMLSAPSVSTPSMPATAFPIQSLPIQEWPSQPVSSVVPQPMNAMPYEYNGSPYLYQPSLGTYPVSQSQYNTFSITGQPVAPISYSPYPGDHERYPFYSYRRPWYSPGPASHNVNIIW